MTAQKLVVIAFVFEMRALGEYIKDELEKLDVKCSFLNPQTHPGVVNGAFRNEIESELSDKTQVICLIDDIHFGGFQNALNELAAELHDEGLKVARLVWAKREHEPNNGNHQPAFPLKFDAQKDKSGEIAKKIVEFAKTVKN